MNPNYNKTKLIELLFRRTGVLSLFLTGVILLSIYAAFRFSLRSTTAILLLSLLLLVALPAMFQYLRYGIVNWLTPLNLFLFLFAVFWIPRSFYIAAKGDILFAAGGPPACPVNHLDHGLGLSLAGIIAFLLSYHLCGLTRICRCFVSVMPGFIHLNRSENIRTVKLSAYIFFLAIFCFYLLFIWFSGGMSYFISHLNVLRFSVGSGKTWIFYIIFMIQPVVWIIFACLLAEKRCGKIAKKSYIGFILCFLIAVFAMLTLGNRSNVLVLAGGLLLIYHYVEKPITFKQIVILLIVSFSFGILMREFRQSLGSDDPLRSVSTASFDFLAFLDVALRDFTSVDLSYFYMDKIPTEHDFLYGTSVTDIPTFMVPRAIWPSKPNVLGPAILLPHFFPDLLSRSHISPSLIGELYVNFSTMGIVGGMSVLGFFYQTATQYLKNHPKQCIEKSVMLSFSLTTAFVFLKLGFFGGIVQLAVVYFLPIILLLYISRIKVMRSKYARSPIIAPGAL